MAGDRSSRIARGRGDELTVVVTNENNHRNADINALGYMCKRN